MVSQPTCVGVAEPQAGARLQALQLNFQCSAKVVSFPVSSVLDRLLVIFFPCGEITALFPAEAEDLVNAQQALICVLLVGSRCCADPQRSDAQQIPPCLDQRLLCKHFQLVKAAAFCFFARSTNVNADELLWRTSRASCGR